MARKQCLLPIVFIIVALMFMSEKTFAQETRQQIAVRAFPSVVLLVMEDANGQPVSLGSGFCIRDGIIATNLHVIEEAMSGYAEIVGQEQSQKLLEDQRPKRRKLAFWRRRVFGREEE